ncbi:MAG: hypothetical protein AAB706_00045 [Patescibacteria group bacterium]
MISIEDFQKVEIKIGKIVSAEKVLDTDKLLRLVVDFGLKPSTFHAEGSPDHSSVTNGPGEEQDIRQVVSGIAEFFPDPTALNGTSAPFVTNIEPRVIRGLESQAMILAVRSESGTFSFLYPSFEVPPGSKVG